MFTGSSYRDFFISRVLKLDFFAKSLVLNNNNCKIHVYKNVHWHMGLIENSLVVIKFRYHNKYLSLLLPIERR